ncbi:TBPIP-domain-containing protein [Lentinula raphanica]|nr:TBPIP-domain-containing protein [Lentinula raphanica]
MASKQKPDVKVLKGQEAEDKVLEYIRRMNRPYGAVDVAANLKGAVPKTATQKILVALAEKGELVQKNYGKTTFFVVNQTKIDTLSPEKISALEEDFKKLDDENKALALQIKTATTELSKIRNLPSDSELEEQLASIKDAVVKRTSLLQPLRSGAPPVSSEEVAQIDTDWLKWREEWIRRKKIFNTLWALATDSLPPQDAAILSEDLGIEEDTPEHTALEKSHLCADTKKNLLKRKR